MLTVSHVLTVSNVQVGCGNSSFSPDLYQAGFQNIVNIDFSSVVIERMQTQHADKSKMEWKVADMTKLDQVFSPASFDIVIDKAAMDALMVSQSNLPEYRHSVGSNGSNSVTKETCGVPSPRSWQKPIQCALALPIFSSPRGLLFKFHSGNRIFVHNI